MQVGTRDSVCVVVHPAVLDGAEVCARQLLGKDEF